MINAFIGRLRDLVAAVQDDMAVIKDVIEELANALAEDDLEKADDLVHDLESRIATLAVAFADLADKIPPADAPMNG